MVEIPPAAATVEVATPESLFIFIVARMYVYNPDWRANPATSNAIQCHIARNCSRAWENELATESTRKYKDRSIAPEKAPQKNDLLTICASCGLSLISLSTIMQPLYPAFFNETATYTAYLTIAFKCEEILKEL
ncbi:MAG TPA: hypothetical protein ENG80_03620 [Nitrospirae bacterium]|nr:hypothetical protein [Nitrospirota bacterium]